MVPLQISFATFLWCEPAACLLCAYLWPVWPARAENTSRPSFRIPGDEEGCEQQTVSLIYLSAAKLKPIAGMDRELIASPLADSSCGRSCFWGLPCLPQGWLETSPAAPQWGCAHVITPAAWDWKARANQVHKKALHELYGVHQWLPTQSTMLVTMVLLWLCYCSLLVVFSRHLHTGASCEDKPGGKAWVQATKTTWGSWEQGWYTQNASSLRS